MAKQPSKFDTSTAAGQERLMRESVGQPTDMLDKNIRSSPGKDWGADPVGDGTHKMVPSGDIVDLAERNRRLKK